MSCPLKTSVIDSQVAECVAGVKASNLTPAVRVCLMSALHTVDLVVISAWLKFELTELTYYTGMSEFCEDLLEGESAHLKFMLHHLTNLRR